MIFFQTALRLLQVLYFTQDISTRILDSNFVANWLNSLDSNSMDSFELNVAAADIDPVIDEVRFWTSTILGKNFYQKIQKSFRQIFDFQPFLIRRLQLRFLLQFLGCCAV